VGQPPDRFVWLQRPAIYEDSGGVQGFDLPAVVCLMQACLMARNVIVAQNNVVPARTADRQQLLIKLRMAYRLAWSGNREPTLFGSDLTRRFVGAAIE
jgi:hypothetical protein